MTDNPKAENDNRTGETVKPDACLHCAIADAINAWCAAYAPNGQGDIVDTFNALGKCVAEMIEQTPLQQGPRDIMSATAIIAQALCFAYCGNCSCMARRRDGLSSDVGACSFMFDRAASLIALPLPRRAKVAAAFLEQDSRTASRHKGHADKRSGRKGRLTPASGPRRQRRIAGTQNL